MSDESNTPDEKPPQEGPQQPGSPEPAGEPFEAEPEGGPFERAREFLRERITQTRSRSQTGLIAENEPAPIPILLGPEPQDEAARNAWAALAEQRRTALRDFRQIRAQKLRSRRPQEAADLLPREAPVPPPADNWIPIGPSVLRQGQGGVQPAVSGRTPAIAVAPGGTRVYIGAANGGVWRSDDTGETWRSLMDDFDRNPTDPMLGNLGTDSLSVGAIAIDPSNPDRIFVGTGEGAGGAYFGVGPVVSLDGGNTWNTETFPGGMPWSGSAFYALAMDPGNPDRLVAGSRQGIFRREPDGSGGFHWVEKILPEFFPAVVTSVVVAQAGGVTTFYAAPTGGPLYSSRDGDTWTKVGSVTAVGVGRISLAVQPNNPSVLYALDQNGVVYRLDLADGNWRRLGMPAGFPGTQNGYCMAIAVAPDNVNRIYVGGGTVNSGGDWSGALYRCEVAISGAYISMVSTYIGGSVHADIHALVFAPGDPSQLWVGCDGGVFFSPAPNGNGLIFLARNIGLQTLTMNHLGPHPTEEAVLFAGTQDNGGERFTGEEAWLYSADGDAGYAVVHWMNPTQILFTYTFGSINRSWNGGQRKAYYDVNLPFMHGRWPDAAEQCLFYAPLVGTPPNLESPTAAADADLVAFGSIRPWISTDFGDTWASIPTNTIERDRLDESIRALVFASPNRLYAGTMAGGVYRFDRAGDRWTRDRIDLVGDPALLPPLSIVTDIAVDPSNPDRIYITFGGFGDYRRVWFFDGTGWEPRSGPHDGSPDSLLSVQANAILVDPTDPGRLYVGTDIGVWRSIDGGVTWEPFSEGLPDAAVTDLILHPRSRLLRAATYGRGVWERNLATTSTPKSGIEMYVRDTQLDQGRFPSVNGLIDPTMPDRPVYHWRGPDIKLDTPDVTGQYQIPASEGMNFYQFVDRLKDFPFNRSPVQVTPNTITRVYVQVHNRGILAANDVQVMLLAANASAGLPPLPPGYDINVRMGIPIHTEHWRTVGIVTLNDVRVGMPKIAAFNLTSNLLPPPANEAGNNHPCVLALIHHPDDPYTSTVTDTDANSLAERKAAQKNLALVQYIFPSPTGQNAAPMIIPFQIHNGNLETELLTGIRFQFTYPYPSLLRLYTPPLQTALPLEESIQGFAIADDHEPFQRWGEEHIRMIRENLATDTPYDSEWSLQRIQAIEGILDGGAGLMFKSEQELFSAELRGIKLEPNSHRTLFLLVDPPASPEFHMLDIIQTGERPEAILGGFSVRLEPVAPQQI
jgi:hypothetical protein